MNALEIVSHCIVICGGVVAIVATVARIATRPKEKQVSIAIVREFGSGVLYVSGVILWLLSANLFVILTILAASLFTFAVDYLFNEQSPDRFEIWYLVFWNCVVGGAMVLIIVSAVIDRQNEWQAENLEAQERQTKNQKSASEKLDQLMEVHKKLVDSLQKQEGQK